MSVKIERKGLIGQSRSVVKVDDEAGWSWTCPDCAALKAQLAAANERAEKWKAVATDLTQGVEIFLATHTIIPSRSIGKSAYVDACVAYAELLEAERKAADLSDIDAATTQ